MSLAPAKCQHLPIIRIPTDADNTSNNIILEIKRFLVCLQCMIWVLLFLVRDGQFRIIYYSRIVKPNPESESFLAISTINMKAFITSLQQQKYNQRTSSLQCNQIMSARVCIMRKQTHSINVCVCELVFESLHAIDTFTKRNSVNKQRDKACK